MTNVANVTANLIAPGTRMAIESIKWTCVWPKLFRIARTRINVQIDLFNLFNLAAILSYNQTHGPTSTTWLTPTSVLAGSQRSARRSTFECGQGWKTRHVAEQARNAN